MEQIAKLLEELAKQLGTTVGFLWGVIIKQAYIAIWQNTIFIICAIGYIANVKRVHRLLTKKHDEREKTMRDYSENLWWIPMGLNWIATFIVVLIGYFAVCEIITAALNPEYWALEKILSTVK